MKRREEGFKIFDKKVGRELLLGRKETGKKMIGI